MDDKHTYEEDVFHKNLLISFEDTLNILVFLCVDCGTNTTVALNSFETMIAPTWQNNSVEHILDKPYFYPKSEQ